MNRRLHARKIVGGIVVGLLWGGTLVATAAPHSNVAARVTKSYITAPTWDVGWPMDNCGTPDQGPGLGGVCFAVQRGDTIRLTVKDASTRAVSVSTFICGDTACNSAVQQSPAVCRTGTIHITSPYATELWVGMGVIGDVQPRVLGGACAIPAPATRGTVVAAIARLPPT